MVRNRFTTMVVVHLGQWKSLDKNFLETEKDMQLPLALPQDRSVPFLYALSPAALGTLPSSLSLLFVSSEDILDLFLPGQAPPDRLGPSVSLAARENGCLLTTLEDSLTTSLPHAQLSCG